jgi:hypothetical protein
VELEKRQDSGVVPNGGCAVGCQTSLPHCALSIACHYHMFCRLFLSAGVTGRRSFGVDLMHSLSVAQFIMVEVPEDDPGSVFQFLFPQSPSVGCLLCFLFRGFLL